MDNIEIPPREWAAFCARFGDQHHGWLVEVSRLATREAADEGAEATPLMAGYRPLTGVTTQTSGGRTAVVVTAGDGDDGVSLVVDDVVALYSRRIGDAHQGLRIDSADGTTTLVQFRTAAVPDALDGLAESER
ncbi:MAG: hypothetical protein U5S82_21280 [Gammaproteobacteria bacterium]|nr:hypothetical protein [Gammaproteobacteria bacterium]